MWHQAFKYVQLIIQLHNTGEYSSYRYALHHGVQAMNV
jgi:hypothetical protein